MRLWLTNLLSTTFGVIARLPLPRGLRAPIFKLYSWYFAVDLTVITQPLSDFSSLAQFFIRDLKPAARPIGTGLLSPVDGKLRSFGTVKDLKLEQIKGRYYCVEGLLQHPQYLQTFADAFYFNLYLSPGDYHHVHSPLAGEIVALTHIPGALFPVNNWSITNIDNLFVRNERVVIYINSPTGLSAVVMVGATNVGKITVPFQTVPTNQGCWQRVFRAPKISHYKLDSPIPVAAGERIGTFNLGSTVILLLAAKITISQLCKEPLPIRVNYGSVLGKISETGQ